MWASSACSRPRQSPGVISTGSASTLAHSGSSPERASPASTRVDRLGTGVDDVSVAHGGRGVAEAEADRLGERHRAVRRALAEAEPERGAELVDVRVAGRGEARRAGADADVARAARDHEVVVERRDPVDRRLRQPRRGRRRAPIVVGDLAVVLDRGLEDLDRGGCAHGMGAAHELDQVP